jgi:hypothetical protein
MDRVIGPLSVLPSDELLELQQLTAEEKRRYFQAGYADFTLQQLVLFRADGTSVIAPFAMFEATPIETPDFHDVEIIDYGQTVRLGGYAASTRSILRDLDPDYKKYCDSIAIIPDKLIN